MKLEKSFAVFAALMFAVLWAAPASAQATRTWVSGVGDDANPCSRTAPCKTWAGAISKTANGGEIDALDPGGFGGLTITKSITLDGGGGQVASVLVAGTNGITVAAQSNDIVIIRNLRFDGLLGNGSSPGSAGINGIQFLSGRGLILEHDDIFGFGNSGGSGVDAEPTTAGAILVLEDVHVQNTLGTGSSGVLIKPGSGGSVKATLTQVRADLNSNGLTVNSASGGADVSVQDSTITSSSGNGIAVVGTGANAAVVWLDNANVYENSGAGLTGTGSAADVFAANSSIQRNGTGISVNLSATIGTYGNNRVDGNSIAGAFNSTLAQK